MKQTTSFSILLLSSILLFLGLSCSTCDNDPLVLPTGSCAKGAFFFESFDTGIGNWHIGNDSEQSWEWVVNGMADSTSIAGKAPNWGKRTPIESCSEGGAMAFNGDGYNDKEGDTDVFKSTLTSPFIDCSERKKVYLRFYQYFRKYQQALTKVLVSNDEGETWTTFDIVQNDTLQSNAETGSCNVQVIDISKFACGFERVCIRFEVEMSHYFWMIDDVGLFDFEPIFPAVTNPTYLGETLADLGYDFEVDKYGAPFVSNELIVQFADSVAESRRQAIRDTMGVVSVDSCLCNKLEVWTVGGAMIINGETISPKQWSVDILEKDKSLTAHEEEGTIQGTGLNYYVHNNEMVDTMPSIDIENLSISPVTSIWDTANTTVIAVLDTGIDYLHPEIKPYIASNNDEIFKTIIGDDGSIDIIMLDDLLDTDANCLVNDFIGWNFVEDNNNPNDNHSHGTHVAGTIIQAIENEMITCPNPCGYKILPVRTHDQFGVGTLFNALCGMYYALQEDATIINASWGFPGENPTKILENVIDTALIEYDALIIAAAGNDTLNMGNGNIMRFPACINRDNVISVASVKSDSSFLYSLSDFSNSSSSLVTIGAEGDSVVSYMPTYQNYTDHKHHKSGTSMATPKVSGTAFLHECKGRRGAVNLRNTVRNTSSSKSVLNQKINSGKVLKENICQ